jgi:folate-dependent phosphoribosylglycinamide formyltransferase PurN
MNLKRLHNPENGVLRIVGLMSGSGTNLRKILEHETALKKKEGSAPYRVTVIFSDNHTSRAPEIGRDYNLPIIIRDIKAYYKAHGLPRRDMTLRAEFDRETVEVLSCFNARCAVYAGYMSIASSVLINAFLGVNVHPADLSLTINGKRRWVGDNAVIDAIRAGEKTICSTTHLIEPEVDEGKILMISRPLEVQIPPQKNLKNPSDAKEIAQENQERLKKAGDWIIFPKTIEYLARGFYAADAEGNLYYNGSLIPSGLRL